MKQSPVMPTWARRVKPHLIRRLYESDAQGMRDEELIDKAGWGLYNQQLNGSPEVEALFRGFVEQFPQARAASVKMLLIDGLIHGFHHFLGSGRTRRPVGVNLIDGDLQFVVDFLDQLSYGPGSTPGLQKNQGLWRENIRGHFRSKDLTQRSQRCKEREE